MFEDKLRHIEKVLHYEVSSDVMKDRCSNDDDIDKRIEEFEDNSAPVIEKLESSGVILKIDASQEVDKVYTQIQEALNLDAVTMIQ